MNEAENEISHAKDYDCELINDDFDKTLEKLKEYLSTTTKN
jgi:guanylate kinase